MSLTVRFSRITEHPGAGLARALLVLSRLVLHSFAKWAHEHANKKMAARELANHYYWRYLV